MKNKLLLLAMGITLSAKTLMAQVPSYVPTNGLVGYWPFSGNANDVSGNGLNGIVNGATLTSDRFGNTNSAYNFTGTTNEITLSNSQNIVNGSFSVSAWCTIDVLSPSNFDATIIGQYNGQIANDRKWLFGYRSFSNERGISYYLCDNTGNFSGNSYSTNWSPQISTWYHITWVFTSGNSIKTYINGVLHSSVSVSLTNFNSSANNILTKIGNGIDIDSPFRLPWNGKIDDVGIWNRALTQTEITNLYTGIPQYSDTCNNVSGSLTQGLVGYWPFCGNANDDSGNGNNGTVNGATLTTDRFGNANSAYDFDGVNDIINASASNLPIGTSSRTISFWYQLNSFNQTNDQKIMIGYGGGTPCSDWTSTIWPNTNFPSLDINFNYAVYSNSLQVGSWYHYVVTYESLNGTNILAPKVYINGVLQTELNAVNNTCSINTGNSLPLVIGGSGLGVSNQFFNGKIDDIGIWNRALTPTEVTQLYNQNQCFTNTTVTDTLVINVGQLSYTSPIAYSNNITIAPNPASTQININFNNITDLNGGTIKIINSLGQQVATTPITTSGTNTSMQLATWGGAGMYFVQIINPQGQIVDIKKIILQ